MAVVIEADRPITFHLPVGAPESRMYRQLEFKKGPNSIESGDWEALRAKKGPQATDKSMADKYLEAGMLRIISGAQANAIIEGDLPSLADLAPKAPLQAAAETYARTKDQEAAMAAAEVAAGVREPPAPKRK